MTRWLRAAQGGLGPLTKPTELTKPTQAKPEPGVLSVKSVLSEGAGPEQGPAQSLPDDLLDQWQERAAIREFDGGQSREEAEQGATRELYGWGKTAQPPR